MLLVSNLVVLLPEYRNVFLVVNKERNTTYTGIEINLLISLFRVCRWYLSELSLNNRSPIVLLPVHLELFSHISERKHKGLPRLPYSSWSVYSRCFKVCFFFEIILDRLVTETNIRINMTQLIAEITTIRMIVMFVFPDVLVSILNYQKLLSYQGCMIVTVVKFSKCYLW